MVFIKSVIIFFVILVVVRIMGKRQLGEMQPFELVITLIIAEVACIPMNDPAVPLYFGIVPVITLATLQVLLSFIARKSRWARRAFSGAPIIAVDKNGINYQNLKRINVNIDDLIEAARSAGYMDLKDIAYAIFETNGNLCVVEKQGATEPTLPLELIVDGALITKNLEKAGIEAGAVDALLRRHNIKHRREVLYMDIRQDGTVYVSPKAAKCFTQTMKLSEGVDW